MFYLFCFVGFDWNTLGTFWFFLDVFFGKRLEIENEHAGKRTREIKPKTNINKQIRKTTEQHQNITNKTYKILCVFLVVLSCSYLFLVFPIIFLLDSYYIPCWGLYKPPRRKLLQMDKVDIFEHVVFLNCFGRLLHCMDFVLLFCVFEHAETILENVWIAFWIVWICFGKWTWTWWKTKNKNKTKQTTI